MKYLLPILIALAVVSCKTTEIVQYKYKSTTMLGTRTITITNDSVMTFYKGRTETVYHSRPTLITEWEELNTAAAEVKLDEISELESPTNRRQTDAAPFGTLFLTTKDSTYKSSTFDGFNAHESIAPILAAIKKISQASPTDQ